MTKKFVSALVGWMLLVAAVTPLPAASNLTQTMTVLVPFAFSAGNKLMPAGDYTVQTSAERSTVVLRHGRVAQILTAIPKEAVSPDVRSKLVFRQYGTKYFLAEVWSQGNTTGNALSPSALEKEIARVQHSDDVLMVQAH